MSAELLGWIGIVTGGLSILWNLFDATGRGCPPRVVRRWTDEHGDTHEEVRW